LVSSQNSEFIGHIINCKLSINTLYHGLM